MSSRSILNVVLLGALLALGALCSHPTLPTAGKLPPGVWGGDHVGFQVTATEARADFDCAHGATSEPPDLDGQGRFDVKGTYAAEHPGPQREDDAGTGKPARYSGFIRGSTMTLTITITATGKDVGTFTLTRDTSPRLTKCL